MNGIGFTIYTMRVLMGDVGFTMENIGFTIENIGFTIEGIGFTIEDIRFTIDNMAFTIEGIGFTIDNMTFTMENMVFFIFDGERVLVKKKIRSRRDAKTLWEETTQVLKTCVVFKGGSRGV